MYEKTNLQQKWLKSRKTRVSFKQFFLQLLSNNKRHFVVRDPERRLIQENQEKEQQETLKISNTWNRQGIRTPQWGKTWDKTQKKRGFKNQDKFEFVCAKNRYVDEEKTGKAEGRKEEWDQEQKRGYAKNGDVKEKHWDREKEWKKRGKRKREKSRKRWTKRWKEKENKDNSDEREKKCWEKKKWNRKRLNKNKKCSFFCLVFCFFFFAKREEIKNNHFKNNGKTKRIFPTQVFLTPRDQKQKIEFFQRFFFQESNNNF